MNSVSDLIKASAVLISAGVFSLTAVVIVPFESHAAMAQSSDALQTTTDTKAAFQRLDAYLRNHVRQFRTNYNSQSMSLGPSRGEARFFIERPNLLRVELSGKGFSYLTVSDGKDFTIYDEKTGKYAQVMAPASPLQALNLFTGLAVFEAQVLRFFGVVDDIANGTSGPKVEATGTETIQGVQCDRYVVDTMRAIADKWEVWLQRNETPLPCKTVVSNDHLGTKQTNLYVWEAESAKPGTFSFTPPPGSTKVNISDMDMRPLY